MTPARAIILNALGLYAIALVLIAAFAAQLILHELPCPLCLLQRVLFAALAIGPILNIRFGPRPSHYALSLFAAVAGAVASTRQVLLHIMPPDPGIGSTLLGLHLYTWGIVTFVVVFAGCGFYLLVSDELVPGPVHYGWVSRMALRVFALTILANAVTVFFEEELHWFLPANRFVH